MEIKDMEINKKYIECMGGIVTKDINGNVYLDDDYTIWNILSFREERQKEILDTLEELK